MVDSVVLAGTLGIEPSWTGGLMRPLLPVPGGTILERLLAGLGKLQGAVLVCANGHTPLIVDHFRRSDAGPAPEVLEDKVPLGTAGCLKLCEPKLRSTTFFVSGGAVWLDDDPEWMLAEHWRAGNAMTVFCTRNPYAARMDALDHFRPAGIYCCESSILKQIHAGRFQDIKEQIVPALQSAGLKVGAVRLRGSTTEVCDWPAYLDILTSVLLGLSQAEAPYRRIGESVWCGEDVRIAPTAHILGPALIGRGTRIGDHATIIGPALVGADCDIEPGARIIRSVAPDGVRLPTALYADEVIPRAIAPHGASPELAPTNIKDGSWAIRLKTAARPAVKVAIAGAFLWAFAPTILSLLDVLRHSPDYSAGLLVPFAALYMLLATKSRFRGLQAAFWPRAIPIFLLGAALNLFGNLFRYSFFENVGLVLAANGLLASLLGKPLYRQAIFPLLFLGFVIPLPHRAHEVIMQPLQGAVAQASASLLEIAGVATERYGHVLEIGGERVAVAEACNGLRLALAFLVVTAVVAYTARRPAWQKAAVLLSCLPIALACNVLRVCGSAYLHYLGFEELAQGAFHDGAGLIMMPFALLMVYAEFWVLSRLVDDSGMRRPGIPPIACPALATASA